ncbi:leucine-rich repeat receptor-like protein kinase PXL1 [Triticum aestivum]|uniref:leucine-rich repeat receptor-like protein kinase PXL1 n=1 Tax=Triticum aestivum TaxID=4565 RepID=UPI001D01671A|nr:leucine-rich repeat receptor-like protein kinase PXL1 [Triticum aestivum]
MTLPTVLNDQGIVNSLTENNKKRMWISRRIGEDELYLVHVQRTAGIGLPTTLIVKKFQNVNPTLLIDDNVKNRCKLEMNLLASICHDNIISVLGVIERDEAIMLAYKYEMNSSLEYWLHQREEGDLPLTWPERMAITIGVAKGLCHLLHGCNTPVVHHNINSNNILLDQDFKAVIASFGAAQMSMAELNQPLPIAEIPVGNFGYAAPGEESGHARWSDHLVVGEVEVKDGLVLDGNDIQTISVCSTYQPDCTGRPKRSAQHILNQSIYIGRPTCDPAAESVHEDTYDQQEFP